MVKTSWLRQQTDLDRFSTLIHSRFEGVETIVSPVSDQQIHPVHYPWLRIPPPNWTFTQLQLKKNHRSCVYQVQRLWEATNEDMEKTNFRRLCLSLQRYCKSLLLFLQKYCSLYRNHSWILMIIIGSLLPITTFPLGFFWCKTLKIIIFSAFFSVSRQ